MQICQVIFRLQLKFILHALVIICASHWLFLPTIWAALVTSLANLFPVQDQVRIWLLWKNCQGIGQHASFFTLSPISPWEWCCLQSGVWLINLSSELQA